MKIFWALVQDFWSVEKFWAWVTLSFRHTLYFPGKASSLLRNVTNFLHWRLYIRYFSIFKDISSPLSKVIHAVTNLSTLSLRKIVTIRNKIKKIRTHLGSQPSSFQLKHFVLYFKSVILSTRIKRLIELPCEVFYFYKTVEHWRLYASQFGIVCPRGLLFNPLLDQHFNVQNWLNSRRHCENLKTILIN